VNDECFEMHNAFDQYELKKLLEKPCNISMERKENALGTLGIPFTQ